MNLKSDHLIYEVLSEIHFEHFKKLDMDPEVMKYYKRISTTTMEARAAFMKYIDYREKFPELGAWAVFTKEKQFIGLGVIIHLEAKPENKDMEFGYRLAREAWGKGHATEIAKALVEYGFKSLNLSDIYGTTNPDNIVSQKVLMKAGLTYIGEAPFYEGCKLFKLARGQWKEVPQA
jgi:[ribosomal protein S5]-alanine N-acetyltransferase